MVKVIHKYAKKNLRKLTRNEEAYCTTCALAKKTRSIDEEDVYLCKAALYDIETLSCYVKSYDGLCCPVCNAKMDLGVYDG